MGVVGVTEFDGVEGFARLRDEMADVFAASHFRFEIERYDRSPKGFVGSGWIRARGRYTGLFLRRPDGCRVDAGGSADLRRARVSRPPRREGGGGPGLSGGRRPLPLALARGEEQR